VENWSLSKMACIWASRRVQASGPGHESSGLLSRPAAFKPWSIRGSCQATHANCPASVSSLRQLLSCRLSKHGLRHRRKSHSARNTPREANGRNFVPKGDLTRYCNVTRDCSCNGTTACLGPCWPISHHSVRGWRRCRLRLQLKGV
jgi:hypothetical protein